MEQTPAPFQEKNNDILSGNNPPLPPEQNNLSSNQDENASIIVPPRGVFEKKEPLRNTQDILPRNGFKTNEPDPGNQASEDNSNNKESVSNSFSVSLPFEPYNENAKFYKIIMGATVLFLTAILIGGIFMFKKNNNSAAPAATSTPIVTPAPTPAANPNLDTDSDGLFDRIEAVIGTDLNSSDTDMDTFSDLNEIKNGYSPLIAGAAGKYAPEDWQAIKDKIKEKDSEFYNKNFGE